MADAAGQVLDRRAGTDVPALASARRVLETEIAGLSALSERLDDSFVRTVDLLDQVSGRIIVTGMGKSGHVARKMAATLASTGAPAQYVHPGEASHGDLGMITTEDAVIALSNSGETAELSDLVHYVKLQRIRLISVTARPDSALARAADVSLVIPDSPEACPLDLAPTTSTTVMMVLGDAIAVALFERRGFSPDDFRMLHPGGQLGRRLLKASDVMHRGDEMPLVGPDTPMTEAILEMTSKRFGCVGVVGPGGALDGMITDGDLRRHIESDLLRLSANEVMTVEPKTVGADILAAQAFAFMNDSKITNVFVVRDGRPVGIIHIHDVLSMSVA